MMHKSKFFIIILLVFLYFTSCADEPIDPALLNIVPAETCATPNGLTVSNFIGTSVNLTWSVLEGSSWEIQYGLHGFTVGAGTSVTSTTTSKTINGLTITNIYDFYIRTNCDNGLSSGWVGPVQLGSSVVVCSNPTGVAVTRSSTTTEQATVSWAANGDENSWQIQYGVTGFSIGSGTTVSSAAPSTIITGLAAASGYDFYVRSNCSATENSNWVGPVHINSAAVVVDSSPALMTANIDGVQFNTLRPYFYSVTQTDVIVTGVTGSGEVRYLKIQGTDNDTSINLNNSRQIDLHIPISKWMPGTYTLFNDSANTTEECWAGLILFTNPDVDAVIVSGTLTVSEFNLGTKRIKGTFAFTYEKFDTITGNSLGIFPVINGTFNYGLDDSYFD